MPSISARRFVATLNNPVRADLPYDWFESGDVVFVAWQVEEGAITGTPHLQIYFIVKENERNKNGHTIKWCSENLSNKMHIAIARGTHDECVDYVTKEASRVDGPWVLGDWTGEPAARAAKGRASQASTLEQVKEKILAGVPDSELWLEHFNVMVRHAKAMQAFRLSLKAKQRNWHTKLLVLYGPPRTGKSSMAARIAAANGGAFWLRKPKDGGTDWWDGYNGEQVVIIDEFYGWLPFDTLVRLCDRYPYQVEFKGSMVPFVSKLIIITSNVAPRSWYSDEAVPDNRWMALVERMSGRLGAVRHMTVRVAEPEEEAPRFSDYVDRLMDGEVDVDGLVPFKDETKVLYDGETDENAMPPPEFVAPASSSYEETSQPFVESDDEDGIGDLPADEAAAEWEQYEEERYMGGTASLGRSGTLSGGVIDLDNVDDLEPNRKKVKRTEPRRTTPTTTLGIEKGNDNRWGKEPVQSTIVRSATTSGLGSRKRQIVIKDDDEDFDDK